ncbi:hypothetical protein GCM10007881_26910 [Mesorhizobium huakuii]|uniref:hypothetical protein n=1 Tax=Mesorhizobium huakuii TaxID=28104 RepID=UPI00235D0BEB|nr:hypothetical protein [Mesorhizobium huakuii]GLQ79173.1 hypothetical protein GCM10007881_26910 [Mesorhizobium huakuii]
MADTAFSKALVTIDWEGENLLVLRCPITGEVVAAGYDPTTGEFGYGEHVPEWENIPTVLFHYTPETGEFDFIRPQLKEEIDRKRQELEAAGGDEEFDDFDVLQEHLPSIGKVPLVFCIETSGIATGPLTSTVYVGLDLAAASA